jgi:hypothetical protein
LVYPFVTTWRTVGGTEYRERTELVWEGARVFLEGSWSPEAIAFREAASSLSRGLLPLLGRIVDQGGSEQALELGQTYLEGFWGLVPRFLWPGKSDATTGNRLGRKYEMIAPGDEITGIAVSQVGEMYINFGGVGVLFGMFAMGVLAAWVDGPLTRRAGLCFLCWVWLPGVLGQESVFGQSLLPLARTVALAWVGLTLWSKLRPGRKPISPAVKSVPSIR